MRVLTKEDIQTLEDTRVVVLKSADLLRIMAKQQNLETNKNIDELATRLCLLSGFSIGLALTLEKSRTGAEHEPR